MQSKTEQRSDDWKIERYGKFSASEIYKLLGIKGLGQTGKNYAIEKAIEELYGEMEENFISYDMQRGIELEPLAFAKFKELKELEFLNVENCSFFKLNDDAGASPDGLVSDDAVLEIKCPKSTTFFELVATNEIDSKYYAQMQMQMLCTNRNKAYFFNYLIHEGTEYHHEIIIERDDKMIELIKERLTEATEIKKEYINKIKLNKQWKS
jgi:exodeoxyribonuclease (lambda-induced)